MIAAAEPYVYVTTTGRVSGQPREIEIWFVLHRDCLYLLAEHSYEANWVKNILKEPRVKLRVGDQLLDATARVLDENRDAEAWRTAQDLARQKYGWGDGLPVEIRPDSPI